MKRPLASITAALLLVGASAPAGAQHGMDFLLVESPRVPPSGTGFVFMRQNYFSQQRSVFQTEPGILYGVTRSFAVELPARIEKPQGRSMTYQATVPTLHLRLSGDLQQLGVGLTAAYAIAHADDRRDRLESAVSVSYDTRRLLTAANVLYQKESGQSRAWGYAAGARIRAGARHGVGIEVAGSFESDGAAEALLGWYGRLSPNFTVNAGIGSGIRRGPDWSARTAFIWRFR